MIRVVLIDIEGTIAPISFVKEVLFPYSKERIDQFIKSNKDKPEIQKILKDIEREVGKKLSINEAVAILKKWIDEDRKITPLKEIQGYIWEEGFKTGELKSPIYKDAYKKMKQWKDKGLNLYIYSSGSIKAQKIFLSNTEYGNILDLFSGHFDTTTGNKKEPDSYKKIAKEVGLNPEEILFLSDNPEEIKAAAQTGMNVVRIVRKNDATFISDFPYSQVSSFDEINL